MAKPKKGLTTESKPFRASGPDVPQLDMEPTPAGDASDAVPSSPVVPAGDPWDAVKDDATQVAAARARGEGYTPPQPVGVTMRKKAAAIKRERAAFHRQAADYTPVNVPEKRLAHTVVAIILDEFALIDERMDNE